MSTVVFKDYLRDRSMYPYEIEFINCREDCALYSIKSNGCGLKKEEK
jgi:hypothetical protein